MTTGLVFHERYLWHDTGHGWVIPNDGTVVQPFEHPENPETKRRMVNLWRACGLLDQLVPIDPRVPATERRSGASTPPTTTSGSATCRRPAVVMLAA